MVLPVLRRIHWGIGRFCFWALASFCLVRKDFWDYSRRISLAPHYHENNRNRIGEFIDWRSSFEESDVPASWWLVVRSRYWTQVIVVKSGLEWIRLRVNFVVWGFAWWLSREEIVRWSWHAVKVVALLPYCLTAWFVGVWWWAVGGGCLEPSGDGVANWS